MADARKLTEAEIKEALETLAGWELRDGKLGRDFEFADFVQAFGFMASCATYAEQVGHHPEWFNVYRKVRVALSTHDVGGISQRDVAMASKMNELAANFQG
jgi:4a-hydroxytetrahydrobiopterin dehydratase